MVEVPVRNARAVQDQWNVRAEERMVNSNTWRMQDTARVAQVVGKFGMGAVDWLTWGLKHTGAAAVGLSKGAFDYIIGEQRRQGLRDREDEDEDDALPITFFEKRGEELHRTGQVAPWRPFNFGISDQVPDLPKQAKTNPIQEGPSSSTSRPV